MQEPTTPEEVAALHDILRTDPQQYLGIVNNWISLNPENANAWYDRHSVWMRLGEPRRALEDLNEAVRLSPSPIKYLARGEVHKHLGKHEEALDDFARSEAMIPDEWQDLGFGLVQQADCHARLGDESKALACCARLHDDFWSPGLHDAPEGDKTGIAARLRIVAAEARAAKKRGETR
jgi:tetratricopeptide (TPR) repeat protein